MKTKLPLATMLALVAGITQAGWSIREGDVKGSNLEAMVRQHSAAVQVIADKDWAATNFAAEKDVRAFQDLRYGMFICFGPSTFVEKDLSWPVVEGKLPDRKGKFPYTFEEWTSWARRSLTFDKFSHGELARLFKASGMRYAVIVAKHHDGFHLWDTKLSDFKVTNTPYGKDYLREMIEACRMAGVKVGIYYSQRDWFHPDYCPVDPETAVHSPNSPGRVKAKPGKTVRPGPRHKAYVDYQFKAIEELCTNYGKIDIFWFDAVWNGGMFTPEMWDAERLTRRIRELQPGIVINNRASVPGDFDTPEQRIGMFQNRRAWETCMTLAEGWSYTGKKSKPKPPADVFRKLQSCAMGDGNLLLSWGPRWDGSWPENQAAVLTQVGDWLKVYGESIYGTRGGPWRPGAWGGATFKGNRAWLHVTRLPKDGASVALPKFPGARLTAQRALSGEGLALKETEQGYELTCGKASMDAPLILELTFDRPLTQADVLPN